MSFRDLLGENVSGKDGQTVPVDDLKKNDVVGLYFSAHWCPPCRGFTPQLAGQYKKLVSDGKKIEIIFVSSDKDEESFNSYFSEMPWMALPYSERALKAKLSKKFKVNGIPSLVLLDQNANLITKNGREKIMEDKEGADFPWAPKPFSEILGDSFIKPNGDVVKLDTFAQKTLAIYFSAHWCPPCKGFTPELIKTYNKVKEAGKDFEVIFASSDRDQESFDSYFGEMPWLAIPFGDARKQLLSSHFEVEGIPTLVILTADGKVINANGRSAVGGDSEGAEFPWHPKSLGDLGQGADGINDTPSLCVLLDGIEDDAELTSKLVAAAQEVADEEKAVRERDPDASVLCFVAKEEGGVVDQIRKLCKVGRPLPKPAVLLLDLDDEGAFYTLEADTALTAQQLREFVASYRAKTLTRQQLQRG